MTADAEAQAALAVAPGTPPHQPPPPLPPVNVSVASASSSVVEEAPTRFDSVLDALYADISVNSKEMVINPEELDFAM